MSEKQRRKNEIEYEQWIEREDGGRIYSFEIPGKSGWKQIFERSIY